MVVSNVVKAQIFEKSFKSLASAVKRVARQAQELHQLANAMDIERVRDLEEDATEQVYYILAKWAELTLEDLEEEGSDSDSDEENLASRVLKED